MHRRGSDRSDTLGAVTKDVDPDLAWDLTKGSVKDRSGIQGPVAPQGLSLSNGLETTIGN